MKITIDDSQTPIRVALKGSLWGQEGAEVEKALTPVVSETGHRVVVDMAGVERIDSRGLGFLVSLTARSNMKEGRIAFARPNEFVQGVLEVTQLTKFLTIAPDLASAQALIQQ